MRMMVRFLKILHVTCALVYQKSEELTHVYTGMLRNCSIVSFKSLSGQATHERLGPRIDHSDQQRRDRKPSLGVGRVPISDFISARSY